MFVIPYFMFLCMYTSRSLLLPLSLFPFFPLEITKLSVQIEWMLGWDFVFIHAMISRLSRDLWLAQTIIFIVVVFNFLLIWCQRCDSHSLFTAFIPLKMIFSCETIRAVKSMWPINEIIAFFFWRVTRSCTFHKLLENWRNQKKWMIELILNREVSESNSVSFHLVKNAISCCFSSSSNSKTLF